MVVDNTSKITGSIMTKLSDAHNDKIATNRANMSQLIEIVLHIDKQVVAFRGHSENCFSFKQGIS